MPFLGRFPITILAIPFLYGPLVIWLILRLAGVNGGERRRTRGLRRAEDRARRPSLLFWACEDCHSLTPEPAKVCYSCGAPRGTGEEEAAPLPQAVTATITRKPSGSRSASGPVPRTQKSPRPSARAAGSAPKAHPPLVAAAPVRPPEPLPAIAWQDAGLPPGGTKTGAAGPGPTAAKSRRRPRLTVVTPDPSAAEAIRQTERFLSAQASQQQRAVGDTGDAPTVERGGASPDPAATRRRRSGRAG